MLLKESGARWQSSKIHGISTDGNFTWKFGEEEEGFSFFLFIEVLSHAYPVKIRRMPFFCHWCVGGREEGRERERKERMPRNIKYNTILPKRVTRKCVILTWVISDIFINIVVQRLWIGPNMPGEQILLMSFGLLSSVCPLISRRERECVKSLRCSYRFGKWSGSFRDEVFLLLLFFNLYIYFRLTQIFRFYKLNQFS